MMSKNIIKVVLGVLLFCSGNSYASDDLKPWPIAKPGYDRKVIRLKTLDNESDHKVEILVGKEMLVDCNRYYFDGRLEERTDIGWGYPSYWLKKPFGPIHTLIGCPQNYKKRKEFVSVAPMVGAEALKRYNSKIPIVVYVPEDFEVRYRIWAPNGDYEVAVSE